MLKRGTLARFTMAAGFALALGTGVDFGLCDSVSSSALAQTAEPDAKSDAKPQDSTTDVLVFKNGNRVEGTIVSETATTIRFKSSVGIAFETDYPKSDILEIKRATKKPDATPAPSGAAASPAKPEGSIPASIQSKATPAAAAPVDPNATKVYFIPLRGQFGEDVSQTPILQAMRDAKAQGASIVVLEMDTSTGSQVNRFTGDRMTMADGRSWNYVERAEQIFPVFHTNVPAEWATPPRVVMLLKQATGAAAFFPFAFKEIYFAPSGVWGGIGTLSELFSGVGDEPVQEKQKSLRLGHVEGWAIFGGYDYRLVRAMSRREYVLSFKVVGGKTELYERVPSDPSEELLTDDGKDANRDVVKNTIESTGNDVLTFNARSALLLGVSKGTVESQLDLLTALGVDRNAIIIQDRGERIMKQWAKNMDNAKTQLTTLLADFQEIRVEPPGDYDARTKARGLRLNKLRQMKSILARFDEGLKDWAQQNLPGIPEIETLIKQIELQQALDRR